MKSPRTKSLLLLLLLLAGAGWLGWSVYQKLQEPADRAAGAKDRQPVPVEVAAIEHGAIERLRTFTGTLEARAEFLLAPKVSGRLEQLQPDLADEVERGEVVAVLDDAEYVQAVARAEADLEVAQASHTEAINLRQIADRELKRIDELRGRGVSSESQRDIAKADQLAKQAQVAVTRARIASAEADLEAARIRLGYTQVSADWRGGNQHRVVAERYVDEGDTVTANTPLLRIVELDPITAVFHVTERDYAHLRGGMSASLETDAYPGERFAASLERIAPVFLEASRQARVELRVENPGLRLKPGMFARATVILERAPDTAIVPLQALTRRDDREGVFLVSEDGGEVSWREVESGIRQGQRVQIRDAGLRGRVVVLGQQLLNDGAAIRIADTPDGAG